MIFFFCYYPTTIGIIKIACIVNPSLLFQLLSALRVFQLQSCAKAPSIDTKVSLMEAKNHPESTAPEP